MEGNKKIKTLLEVFIHLYDSDCFVSILSKLHFDIYRLFSRVIGAIKKQQKYNNLSRAWHLFSVDLNYIIQFALLD